MSGRCLPSHRASLRVRREPGGPAGLSRFHRAGKHFRIDIEHRTANTSVLALTRSSIWSRAAAQFNLPLVEVCLKLHPFLLGDFPVLVVRASAAATSKVSLVMADDILVEHRLWRRQILQLSECLSLAVCSAANFGGVVGPVACGGALPGHGDGDVNAEHAGEDGGGQVGSEMEQRGGAVSGGLESELAESLGECVRADRAPGLAAGEQPWRGTGSPTAAFP